VLVMLGILSMIIFGYLLLYFLLFLGQMRVLGVRKMALRRVLPCAQIVSTSRSVPKDAFGWLMVVKRLSGAEEGASVLSLVSSLNHLCRQQRRGFT